MRSGGLGERAARARATVRDLLALARAGSDLTLQRRRRLARSSAHQSDPHVRKAHGKVVRGAAAAAGDAGVAGGPWALGVRCAPGRFTTLRGPLQLRARRGGAARMASGINQGCTIAKHRVLWAWASPGERRVTRPLVVGCSGPWRWAAAGARSPSYGSFGGNTHALTAVGPPQAARVGPRWGFSGD